MSSYDSWYDTRNSSKRNRAESESLMRALGKREVSPGVWENPNNPCSTSYRIGPDGKWHADM